jgi:hypothetical protein
MQMYSTPVLATDYFSTFMPSIHVRHAFVSLSFHQFYQRAIIAHKDLIYKECTMLDNNKEIVRTFEEEFKNKANLAIVDQVMASPFIHHAPIPGIAPGPAGMKQIGQFVFSQIDGIKVTIIHLFAEGDLVCSRISANGTVKQTAQTVQ